YGTSSIALAMGSGGMVLLVDAVVSIIIFFVPVRFGAIIQAAIYNVALYLVVVQLYFVFALE
ncbi:hypothetical protein, partial [Escherichia coli]|uniref:hypothetical protein n=1 Tax=Escherichia coli TaxID=562 RepID=UPI001953315B